MANDSTALLGGSGRRAAARSGRSRHRGEGARQPPTKSIVTPDTPALNTAPEDRYPPEDAPVDPNANVETQGLAPRRRSSAPRATAAASDSRPSLLGGAMSPPASASIGVFLGWPTRGERARRAARPSSTTRRIRDGAQTLAPSANSHNDAANNDQPYRDHPVSGASGQGSVWARSFSSLPPRRRRTRRPTPDPDPGSVGLNFQGPRPSARSDHFFGTVWWSVQYSTGMTPETEPVVGWRSYLYGHVFLG